MMQRINGGRVILGGLLAGFVMNASEAALHLEAPLSTLVGAWLYKE